jgi:hypothetical protein
MITPPEQLSPHEEKDPRGRAHHAASQSPPHALNTSDRLALLFLGGVIAFTPPILLTVNKARLIFGIPLLYLWLFGIWLFLIIGVMYLNRRLKLATSDDAPQAIPGQTPPERAPQLPPMGD